MKSNAILLNLGRGPIIDETALADALKNGQIAAAGLDVLSEEPMRASSPLLEILDHDNLLITPHIGWASVEARTRLMQIITEQIREIFLTEYSRLHIKLPPSELCKHTDSRWGHSISYVYFFFPRSCAITAAITTKTLPIPIRTSPRLKVIFDNFSCLHFTAA